MPLDQYLAAHPRYIFESSPEHALINPDNLALLVEHLRCAAFELPFEAGENFGLYTGVADVLQVLAEEGELHQSGGQYRWVAAQYPAEGVSLRSAGADKIIIQAAAEDGRPVVIGEVDRASAPVRVHTGAVYLHEGRGYVVTELDWEAGQARVKAEEVDYFTQAAEAVDIEIVNVYDAHEAADEALDEQVGSLPRSPAAPLALPHSRAWGELLITAQAASYRMVRRYTHETLGYGEIKLPPRQFQTTGYWLWLPPAAVKALAEDGILVGPNNYGPNWETQRNAARARDGFQCVQCGKPEEGGRQHDVHHLQPFRSFGYVPGLNDNYKLANDLSNLQTLCRACHARAETGRGTQTALGGLAYALGNLAPLHLMCDPRDLGIAAEPRSRETKAPTITIFDLVPDGLGFAERLYELHAELLDGAYELIDACPCRDGCPACVGPVGLEATETKEMARRLAARLAGRRV
jgi:DEAD/DEAH box helicase domain-containing protein